MDPVDIGSQIGLNGVDLVHIAVRVLQMLLGFAPLLSLQ